jgi:UDP-glucose 4-epimerase
MAILVTGGAGSIGSHVVRQPRAEESPCLVLDNLSRGHGELVGDADLKVGAVGDTALVGGIIAERAITAVNPYGATKLIVERILADPSGLLGEWHEPETQLVPLALEAVESIVESAWQR